VQLAEHTLAPTQVGVQTVGRWNDHKTQLSLSRIHCDTRRNDTSVSGAGDRWG